MIMNDDAHKRAQDLAHQSLADGDATAWFDSLYAAAKGDASRVPWAHLCPNPLFEYWLKGHVLKGAGCRAAQVGCGLGDDGELMASFGFDTTAFDISPEAVNWCRERFPESGVHYTVADLLAPPVPFRGGFDFVLECFTIQSLPLDLRERAIRAVSDLVSPGGTLLVITRLRDPHVVIAGPPWPLTLAELEMFESTGLRKISTNVIADPATGQDRRCLVEYRRAAAEA